MDLLKEETHKIPLYQVGFVSYSPWLKIALLIRDGM